MDQLVKEVLAMLNQFGVAGTTVVVSGLIFLLVRVVRGDAGFDVPALTNLLNRYVPDHTLPLVIALLSAIAGAVGSIGEGMTIETVVAGAIAGLLSGLGAVGLHQIGHQAVRGAD